MDTSVIKVVKDGEALARTAAAHFVERAAEAIQMRNRFAVVLSGGSTPKRMHALLASAPLKNQVDWSKVFVFLGDERFLPPDDENSNFYMAQNSLLSDVAIPPENIYPFLTTEVTPEEAAEIYEAELRRFFGSSPPQFDLIFLGMGEDGHTASLFPGFETLEPKPDDLVQVVEGSPKPPPTRLTLSYNVLNAAHHVLFLVGGESKRKALKAIFEEDEALPAALVEPAGKLTWLLDEAAAAELSL